MELDPEVFEFEGPNEDFKKFILRHELGHVLGLLHEWERPDWQNHIVLVQGRKMPKIGSWWSRVFNNYTLEYDYESVMNYPNRFKKRNPDGAGGDLIGKEIDIYKISKGDGKTIQHMYGGSPENFNWE